MHTVKSRFLIFDTGKKPSCMLQHIFSFVSRFSETVIQDSMASEEGNKRGPLSPPLEEKSADVHARLARRNYFKTNGISEPKELHFTGPKCS